MRAVLIAVALVALLAAAGCASAVDGVPESPRSPASTSIIDPTTGLPPAIASLCPDAEGPDQLTDCLRRSVADYWSAQLNDAVDEPVVLHPDPNHVPDTCVPGLTEAPAFTCPADGALYFTDRFLDQLESSFDDGRLGYAFAVVQGHELGHVVQFQVHQPQIEARDPTRGQTLFVEQQADCLSGVWAANEHSDLGLDPDVFRDVAAQLLELIETPQEVARHGSTEQRLAAIERGLAGGRPQSCQLATFS